MRNLGARLLAMCGLACWITVSAASGSSRCNRTTTPPNAEARSVVEEKARRAADQMQPFDDPDLAWAYARQKRLGAGTRSGGEREFDSVRAYRKAEAQVARMPRSRASGREPLGSSRSQRGPARVDETRWEWLGPGNIGGRTRALVVHPQKPRIMYVAGVSGGVWKTKNKGRRWTPVGDRLSNLAVNSLVMDPNNPAILYAGTGEGYFREVVRGTSLPLRGGGIFKTTDGGANWELLEKTRKAAFQWVNDLVVSPLSSQRLYAATRQGVFRSTNAGRRWRRILKASARGGCLDLALSIEDGADALFASCGTLDQATVFLNPSAQDSREWQAVLTEPGMGRTSLAIAPSDPSVVYALSASNVPGPGGNFEQGLHAVFRSTAGGLAGTWEARLRNSGGRKIDQVILSNPIVAFVEECGFQGDNRFFSMGWYVNLIAVDPKDADRVWVAGVDLFRSDDGAASFDPATNWWDSGSRNFVHADHHSVVFHPKNGKRMFSLNDGGIYELRNPRAPISRDPLAVCSPDSNEGVWKSLNNSYGVTQFYHGSVAPDATWFIAGAQDNGTVLVEEASGPNQGVRIFGGDGGYSAIDPSNPRVVYVTVQNGRLLKSIDGGLTFSERVFGISDLESNTSGDFRAVGPNFLFISPLEMDPNERLRLWLGGRRLWRSDDGAVSWRAASARFSGGDKVSAIAVAPGRSDVVVVGTDSGWIYRSDGATRSGTEEVWLGTQPRVGFVSSLAFDSENLDTIYATYATFNGDHVWRSDDGGASWSALDGRGADALPDLPVHSIVVDPNRPQRLFLGTDLGVFVSPDRGASWSVEASGLPAAVTEWIRHVETPSGESYLYAFTHGRGAWRLHLDP